MNPAGVIAQAPTGTRRRVRPTWQSETPEAVPTISPLILRFFRAYTRRHIRKHFHAVRVARLGLPPEVGDAPMIVFMNHPSWWDPLLALYLADRYFHDRSLYAPIDAAQLERYAIFRRLGFYGVEKHSLRGAKSFLNVSRTILAQPRHIIWMTPQGRFVDPRQTEFEFDRGLAMLIKTHPHAQVLSVAVDYVFWNDRLPEALVRFGKLSTASQWIRSSPDLHDINHDLTRHLAELQRQLAEDSMAREEDRFLICDKGASGVGGVYDWHQRMRAWIAGKPFDPDHGGTQKP